MQYIYIYIYLFDLSHNTFLHVPVLVQMHFSILYICLCIFITQSLLSQVEYEQTRSISPHHAAFTHWRNTHTYSDVRFPPKNSNWSAANQITALMYSAPIPKHLCYHAHFDDAHRILPVRISAWFRKRKVINIMHYNIGSKCCVAVNSVGTHACVLRSCSPCCGYYFFYDASVALNSNFFLMVHVQNTADRHCLRYRSKTALKHLSQKSPWKRAQTRIPPS